jgi:hypothetical protein
MGAILLRLLEDVPARGSHRLEASPARHAPCTSYLARGLLLSQEPRSPGFSRSEAGQGRDEPSQFPHTCAAPDGAGPRHGPRESQVPQSFLLPFICAPGRRVRPLAPQIPHSCRPPDFIQMAGPPISQNLIIPPQIPHFIPQSFIVAESFPDSSSGPQSFIIKRTSL